MAYILTRPLGASLGDYLSQPKADGGLGLGTTTTSLIFLTAILGRGDPPHPQPVAHVGGVTSPGEARVAER